jgi:LysR family transcriptional regulator, nitrogen assimilation regulatory protein
MQFRHLRYFVKIVEAGSFSRAAAVIHVAQPALSQQIHELEERLGIILLHRGARGVRPTAAGEVLFREAAAILRQVEQLPGIIRSATGEPEGTVALGLAVSLAPKIIGGLIQACRSTFPKVSLRVSDADSETLASGIRANKFDLALLYEDEFGASFLRKPLFQQNMFLISAQAIKQPAESISVHELAKLPLVLPSLPNGRRILIDRALAEAGIKPNLVTEADTLATEIAAVRAGVGCTILPTGDMSNYPSDAFAVPLLIEPPIYLTCSVIVSSDFPPTYAGEAVQKALVEFMSGWVKQTKPPGVQWIA